MNIRTSVRTSTSGCYELSKRDANVAQHDQLTIELSAHRLDEGTFGKLAVALGRSSIYA